MKVLLVAYEFPPILSAQSLRWYYLSEELRGAGFDITVLAPRISDRWGFNANLSSMIRVERCFPGPFIGLSGWLAREIHGPRVDVKDAESHSKISALSHLQSLSERLYRLARNTLNQIIFTDIRSEWYPFGWMALKRLLREESFDVLVSSFEPGVDLQLGLRAQQEFCLPWVVDMADPLVTIYTPRWRRALDRRFEAKVCTRADHILVTNANCTQALTSRHGVPKSKFSVVGQGFSEQLELYGKIGAEPNTDIAADTFTLAFTGNFYPVFRDPKELARALCSLNLPHLRFVVAGADPSYREIFRPLGERLRWLGPLDHFAALRLQRKATLLLNIGNRQAEQVPGKLFEYFGARRPILHIAGSEHDPAVGLLRSLKRGEACQNRVQDIATAISRLYVSWERHELDNAYDLTLDAVREYSWEQGAKRVAEVLQRTLSEHR